MKTLSIPRGHELRITLIYLLVAGLWILFSDRLLTALVDSEAMVSRIQTYKGLFFVLVTSAMLYYLIRRNSSTILRSRDRLQDLLHEKQVLLSELHHRVKNNLAIITGLIELETESMEKTESDALRETQFRIYTLADIEELMYQEEDMTNIPFHEFMEQLISSLHYGDGNETTIKSDISELNLNINQAVPLALLVNEILSQFRINDYSKDYGSLNIDLRYSHPSSRVTLEINLEKVPVEILNKLTDSTNVEATLIRLYTNQLKAESSWKPIDEGGSFTLIFKKSNRSGSSSRLMQIAAN